MKKNVPLKLDDETIESVEKLRAIKSKEMSLPLNRNEVLTMLINKGFQMLKQEGYKK